MKKLIVTLSFLSIYLVGTAQEKFTQVIMQQMIDEYKADSKAFFINRLSDDFRFTPPSGGDYIGKSTVIAWSKSDILKVEMLETKIFTSGNLAVISGIMKDEKVEKNPELSKVTFTFQNRGGKWFFIASQYAPQPVEKFTEAQFLETMGRLQSDKAFYKNETDPSLVMTFASGATNNQEGMIKMGETLAGRYHRTESNVKIAQKGNVAVATGIVNENISKKESPNTPGPTLKYAYTYTFVAVNGKWLLLSGQHTDLPVEKFTKTTLQQILDEYKADSKTFFINRLSDDFKVMSADGTTANRAEIISRDTQKILNTEILDLNIINAGNLAIVTGLHQTVRQGNDGNPTTGKVNATYTFQNRGGKWFFVASQQTSLQ